MTKRAPKRDEEHGEGVLAFEVDVPFDPAALDAEVTEAMGWRNQAGLVVEGDPLKASKDEPVVVWVLRPDIDTNTFKRAVGRHEPPTERPRGTVTDLLAKARSGDAFTEDEIQTALRILLLRS